MRLSMEANIIKTLSTLHCRFGLLQKNKKTLKNKKNDKKSAVFGVSMAFCFQLWSDFGVSRLVVSAPLEKIIKKIKSQNYRKSTQPNKSGSDVTRQTSYEAKIC